jgi:hypothetical protein
MASTSPVISAIPAHSLLPEGSPPYGGVGRASDLVAVGLGKGVGFPAGATSSALYVIRLAAATTLTTGLRVDVVLADDPADTAAKAGKNSYFGVTIGPIGTTNTLDENASTGPLAGSTEVAAAVTMPATPGVLKTATFSIPVADLNGLAASGWALLRVRRIGGNAGDTDPGRVALLALDVYDY